MQLVQMTLNDRASEQFLNGTSACFRLFSAMNLDADKIVTTNNR